MNVISSNAELPPWSVAVSLRVYTPSRSALIVVSSELELPKSHLSCCALVGPAIASDAKVVSDSRIIGISRAHTLID